VDGALKEAALMAEKSEKGKYIISARDSSFDTQKRKKKVTQLGGQGRTK